jgi:hypothetical protein
MDPAARSHRSWVANIIYGASGGRLQASSERPLPSGDAFDLVRVARLFRDQEVEPATFIACFKISTVYAVRPERPGLMVADLLDMGRWVRVYSSLDHLGDHEGAVSWMRLLGVDVMNLLPPDIGFVLDPHLSHAAAIPPRGLGGADAISTAPALKTSTRTGSS